MTETKVLPSSGETRPGACQGHYQPSARSTELHYLWIVSIVRDVANLHLPMPWSFILLAPDLQQARVTYELVLPLIAGGRVSLAILHSAPARARVVCQGEDGEQSAGQIMLDNNRWVLRWEPDNLLEKAPTRLTAARFLPGDPVILHPAGRRMELFHVASAEPFQA